MSTTNTAERHPQPGATHKLTRNVGKIPSGTTGTVLGVQRLASTGDMPVRETDLGGTNSRYPYTFTPDPASSTKTSADAFKFAAQGFLVQATEVAPL